MSERLTCCTCIPEELPAAPCMYCLGRLLESLERRFLRLVPTKGVQ
jgi:hypothetical protein